MSFSVIGSTRRFVLAFVIVCAFSAWRIAFAKLAGVRCLQLGPLLFSFEDKFATSYAEVQAILANLDTQNSELPTLNAKGSSGSKVLS